MEQSKISDDVLGSKVLHVRGLPPYTSRNELEAICQPFGNVTEIFLLQGKNQGFVQMDSISSAQKLLDRYSEVSASIRGKPVYFQFSNRGEITTNNNRNQQTRGGIGEGMSHSGQENANSILLISFLKLPPSIALSLEQVHQIFRPFGDVLKIVLFKKDNIEKALVQMGTIDSAISAKLNLEGKDLVHGCCHLRIGYSTRKDLEIRQSGPRKRDFTLNHGEIVQPSFRQMGQNPSAGYLFPNQQFPSQFGMGFSQDPRYDQKSFGDYSPNLTGSISSNLAGSMGMAGLGEPEFGSRMGYSPQPGCVILCSNLPEDEIDPDKLFTLFGVYGDVMRVKILYQKRDTALIQFADPHQAHLAMSYLSHLQFYGKEISISPSRHLEINMPPPGTSEDENIVLTKDFSGVSYHRFKNRESRNYKNIHPPARVLHVSRLHENATEEELRELFGGDAAVQFFASNRTMAFVKMETLQDAVVALIKTHNYQLKDRYIRVAFSARDPDSVNNSDEMHETLHQ